MSPHRVRAGCWRRYSECERTAIVERLNLRDRGDSRTYAGCLIPTGIYDIPGRGDCVRLLVVDWNDKIKAMGGECTQDQLEIAGRIWAHAYTRQRASSGIVTRWEARVGAVCSGSTRHTTAEHGTGRKLREQLRTDLLEPFIINDAASGKHPGAASINANAHLDSDLR